MPLKGIKVVEFVGLAPGPFCGKILADFGATVTRIDKTPFNQIDICKEGKRTVAINLKQTAGQEIARKICLKSDVVLEPFRPGVMERLGLGPNELLKINPRLIYARLTGFGQTGTYAQRAGHDINYVALSGILSLFGRKNEKPTAPVNFAADLAGGSLVCAFGILAALFEREKSGKGQIIDAAMVEGTAYIGSWLVKAKEMPMAVCDAKKRGENLLDTGSHFYDTYKTKDGKYMSVGSIEPQFYNILAEVMGLGNPVDQLSENELRNKILTEKFLSKTQDEWTKIFENTDACVYPVLHPEEVHQNQHNKERNTFSNINPTMPIANPAPILSRTPAMLASEQHRDFGKDEVQDVLQILQEIGVKGSELKKLYETNVILLENSSKL